MARRTGPEEPIGGLRLRAELARGPEGPRARLLAGPAELAPGLRLVALVAEPQGQVLGAEIRRLRSRATDLRLEVEAQALAAGAQALVGARLAGWRIAGVEVEIVGEALVVALSGPGEGGWPGLVQIELAAAAEGRGVALRPRRAWCLAPLRASPTDLCRRLAALAAARCPGVVAFAPERHVLQGMCLPREMAGCGVWIDPVAGLRRAFVAAGGRPPGLHGLALARLRGEGRGVRLHWTPRRADGSGLEGHVHGGMAGEVEDPWAALREVLLAEDRGAALAELDRCAPGPETPGARRLARALAQVRAGLWRFVDPVREAAALRAWIAAAPEDPEAWWRVTLLRARAQDTAGVERGLAALERGAASPAAALRGRAARAIVQARMGGAGRAIVDGLEDMVRRSGPGQPAALAAGWRALALTRAVDPGVPGAEVRAAVEQALAEGGPRPWCTEAELRLQIGEAELGRRAAGRLHAAGGRRGREGAPGRRERAGAGERVGAREVVETRDEQAAGREVGAREVVETRDVGAREVVETRDEQAAGREVVETKVEQAVGREVVETRDVQAAGREVGVRREQAARRDEQAVEREVVETRVEVRDEVGMGREVVETRDEVAVERREVETRGEVERGETKAPAGEEERACGGGSAGSGEEGDEGVVPRALEGADGDAEITGVALWPALIAAGEASLRDGGVGRIDAVLAGDAGRARASRPQGPALSEGAGALLAWSRVYEGTGEPGAARGLVQLVGFMAPGSAIARSAGGLAFVPARAPAQEGFAAIAEVLGAMVHETAGIRAVPARREGREAGPEAEAARTLAETEVRPWRARLGLLLPVIAGRRGPPGGVGIHNEREPAIVAGPGLLRLAAAERRFRLALAAALIHRGLAVLLDPRGASLSELLEALRSLAEGEGVPDSPGAAAIVRVWRRRGGSGERWSGERRAALRAEVIAWQHRGAAALASRLRREGLAAALALSGTLAGALWTIGRDAKVIGERDVDLASGELSAEAVARALATEEAEWLLRAAGLVGGESR